MAVRESNFEIAALEAGAEVEDEELLDARIATGVSMMFRRPTQGQFAVYSLAFGRREDGREVMPKTDHFLRQIVIEPEEVAKIEGYEKRDDFVGVDWLWDRVEDREYPDFEIATISEVIGQVIKAFGGFPTRPSSASTSSRRSSGQSSTASSRRVGSTRSRSASDDSAT